MPLDDRPLHLHKSQKGSNVNCLLSQCTTLKQILMEHWSLIHNHPLLKTIFPKPPIISYKRENPLKKCFRKQKYNLKAIMQRDHKSYTGESVPVCLYYLYSQEGRRHLHNSIASINNDYLFTTVRQQEATRLHQTILTLEISQ